MNLKDILSTDYSQFICAGTGLIALDVVISNNLKVAPKMWAGGSCGNVMAALAYLGWQSYPIARLGKDNAGENVKADFDLFQVKTDLLEFDERVDTPIIIEKVFKDKNGYPKHKFSFTCLNCGSWLPRYRPVLLKKIHEILDKLPEVKVFYFDRVSPAAIKLAELLRKRNTLIVFEPSSIKDEKLFWKALQLSHILKYSHEQLGHIEFLSRELPVMLQVETLGVEGLRYRRHTSNVLEQWHKIPAFNIHGIKDAAGSGDWCTTGIIHCLCQNGFAGIREISDHEIYKSLKFSQALSALNCFFEGARGGMYVLQKEQFRNTLEKIISGEPYLDFVQTGSTDKATKIPLFYSCPACKHCVSGTGLNSKESLEGIEVSRDIDCTTIAP